MKAKISLVAALICALMLAGCVTATPVSDGGGFPGDAQAYEILGRVALTEIPGTEPCFSRLYEAAKEQYPDCDDIVNVKIDEIKTTMGPFFGYLPMNATYNASGIAIRYKNKVQ